MSGRASRLAAMSLRASSGLLLSAASVVIQHPGVSGGAWRQLVTHVTRSVAAPSAGPCRGFACRAVNPPRPAPRTATAPLPTRLRGMHTASAGAAAVPFSHALVSSPGAQRAVGAWLFGGSAWVFSLVVLGGVTRLTRSGLSMTEWRFTGERAPRCQSDWEEEFLKYRASPEFQRVNRSMSLDDFKFIFWMEYAHRMWGRTLGLYFAVPLSYFLARGYVRGALGKRLVLLFAAGGTQGFVGWWMVKSGLEQPRTEHEIPRVSPYRLAAHLSTAFAIYSALLWTALDVAFPAAALADASLPLNRLLSSLAARRRAHGLAGLIAVTALSGAFVAGLDAGHAYNTFPLMGGRLVPQEYGSELPWWRNSFENTAAVQFHHRVLALSTAGGVWAAWAAAQVAPPLPRAAALATHALACAVGAQVSLGIATLLSCVPVWLGAVHQAGALTLLSAALVLLHTLRAPAHVKARAAAALREAATAPGARTGALVAAK